MSRSTSRVCVALGVLAVVSAHAQSPTVDGFVRDPVTGVVEAPYVLQGITYTQDSLSGVFAGILYQAEDATTLYFAFEQSVHINDNSYGANSIGWPAGKSHKLKDLTQSEHAKIQLFDCAGNLVLDFYLDYASRSNKHTNNEVLHIDVLGAGGDGALNFGDVAHIVGESSSLDWNHNQAVPLYPNRINASPARLPTNTYDPGTSADPAYPWIYPLVYEWAIDKAAFSANGFCGGLVISEVHNSPLKTGTNPVPEPILTVSKVADPVSGSDVVAGDQILYTVSWHNTGLSALTQVTITDVVDPNLDDVIPLDGGTYDSVTRTITWPTIASIGPGESGTVSFLATVTPLTGDPTDIYNFAVFTSPDLFSDVETNVTEHHVIPSPDLAVTKSCPALAVTGNTISYTVTVENLGTVDATSVTLTDALPPEVQFVSAIPAPTGQSGNTVTWDLGTVSPGAQVIVDITANVTALAGVATNSASVIGAETEDPSNNTTTCSTEIFSPDVYVSKGCPATVVGGETASYSLVVGNSGTSTAANVVVVDTLPAGVSFVSATPAPTSVVGGTVTFELGSVAAGATQNITIDVDVNLTSGTLTNAVSISTDTPEGGDAETNNSDACASTITAPDLAVSKSCPTELIAGETAVYAIAVNNGGTADALGVIVTDTLPAGVSYVGASPTPTVVSGQTITWSLGTLAAGGTVPISVDVAATATSGSQTNTVSVSSDSLEGGAGSANNSDSCGSPSVAADLSVQKTCPVDMTAGEPASYELLVSNVGAATAKDVVITDTLPAGVEYVSASPTPSTVSGSTLTWALGDIASAGSTTISVTVNPVATSGSETNTASGTTSSQEGGEGSANNSDSCQSTFIAPDVVVAKTCPVDMVAGTQSAYVLTISNTGTASATNVEVVDLLPAEVAYVSASPAPVTVAGQSLTFALGDLAVGASTTITITVDVTATAGTATNSASATTDSVEGGSGAANNSDACSSSVLSADVSVSKTCPADMIADEPAAYTVVVSNDGTATANAVTLVDVLPAGVDFVSATPPPSSVAGQTLTFGLGDLAPGASTTITITVNPTATSGSGTNSASATTSSTEGGQGSANNSDACSSNFLAPDLAVSTTCPVDMVAGEPAAYTVTVSNGGTSAAKGVVLTDVLPAGVSYTSASLAPDSVSGQTLTWSLGDLAAGGSVTITIDVTALSTSGVGTNSASATTTSTQGGAGATNDSDSCQSTFIAPDVAIDKTCPIDMITDEPATYTLLVSNLGTSTAKSVTVSDTLPAEVSFLSATPAPTTAVGQTLTWDLGDLAVGASVTIDIVVNPDATTGNAVNDVSVTTTSVEGGQGSANNDDSCVSTVQSPDLSVSTSCPANLTTGETATFTVTVDNGGSSTADGVVLTDVLPDGVTFSSASVAPDSAVGQTLTWSLGDIAPGGSVTITIDVTPDATSGVGTNSVSVVTASTQGGGGTSDDTDSCQSTFIAPDVVVAKTCPVDMVAGTQSAYVLTISNTGTASATNVEVVDLLPAEVAYVSASPAPVTVAGQSLTFALGDLAVGASTTITITVDVTATAGTATNSASATTDSVEGGSGAANNSDACSSSVLSADVSVSKTCPADMIADEPAAYTVVVSNDGTATANAVTLVDVLPAGVDFVSATPPPSSVAGQTLTFGLGDLAPGASTTITITVNPTATSGSGTNSASATTSSTEGGQGSANNSDACSSNFLAPDLAVSTTCPVDMVAGEPAAYTVTVSNGGTSAAKGVVLTDVLPAGVSYTSASLAPDSVSGQTLTWSLGDLAAGGSVTITIDVTALSTSGVGTNSASATTTSTQGGAGATNDSDSCQSTFIAPDVAIDKTCPIDMITDEPATYTLLVSNLGTSPAKGMVVTDTLPDSVTFVSSTPSPTAISGQELTWSLGDLAAGGTLSIVVTVNPDATTGSSLNAAIVSTTSQEGGQGSSNNADECESTFKAPDVGVSVVCPVDMVAGEAAAYTVTVDNLGTSTAKDVVLTDVLPAGVTFDGASLAPTSVVGQTLTWVLGDMAPGSSVVITIDVTPVATGGIGTNSASATTSSAEGGAGSTNNAASCDSNHLSPDVTVATSCIPGTANANSAYSLVVTFSNDGTTDALDAVLTDTVPAGFFASDSFTASSTLGAVSVSGTTVTVTLGALAPGASGTLTISGTVSASASASGDYTNSAVITTTRTQSDASNDSAACTVTVTAPNLALSKTSSTTEITTTLDNSAVASAAEVVEAPSASTSDTVVTATRVTYTLTVTNNGDGVASAVTVTDTLPTGISIVDNPDGGVVSGDTVTWAIPSLAVAASVTLTLTVETVNP